MKHTWELREVLQHFAIDGQFVSAEPYGSGHIHDSYCAAFAHAGRTVRYTLQRLNTQIFREPEAVMENIERVTAHLIAKAATAADGERRALRLVATRDGRHWHVDADKDYWRVYRYIEGASAFDMVASPRQAYEAAKAFGLFQRMLLDLPGERLRDTIAGFHDTPKRFVALERAIAVDAAGRVKSTAREIDFALENQAMASVLMRAGLPERVIHNDTKLNNVLLDDGTGEGICVIDLDTVMPGPALYDFGDMVRTMTCTAKEDETDLSMVALRMDLFEGLARGYQSAANFLADQERELMVFSGKLIVLEQGVRFLTDYLAGDTYYKVSRPEQNLDRCRTQFKLLESIEEQEAEMERMVRAVTARSS